MPLFLPGLYILAHSHHAHHQRNIRPLIVPCPSMALPPNPVKKYLDKKQDILDTNYLAALAKQIKETTKISYKLTTQTIENIRKTTQRTRHVIFSSIRKVPLTKPLSDDYIYGCIDTLFTATVISLTLITIKNAARKYNTVEDIPRQLIKRQVTLKGTVISVRDGDNIRIEHKPLLNFDFITNRNFFKKLLIRNVKSKQKSVPVSQRTINIRLAGIDAPECPHGVKPGQPYGREARAWLRAFTLDRPVKFQLHSTDQYNRLIATAYIKRSNLSWKWRNVGLELTKAGYATLYEGTNAVYGSKKLLQRYISAESLAKKERRGMWSEGTDNVVLPSEFKKMLRDMGSGKGDRFDVNNTNGKVEIVDENAELVKRVANFLDQGYQWLKKLR